MTGCHASACRHGADRGRELNPHPGPSGQTAETYDAGELDEHDPEAVRRLVSAGAAGAGGRVQAVWNGAVLADSERTVVVEGKHYFPPEDVNREYLLPSPRHSVCFWKGRASYYDAVVEGERNAGAAWYYPSPSPAAGKIKDHVAFWHGVKVQRVPAPRSA